MRQNLGQHFLQNETVISEIIDAIDPEPGDVVVEVGTGHGELTLPLAKRCQEQQCRIVTIEKDPALAELFRRQTPENVRLIGGDARELLSELLEQHTGKTVKLVGNLPYYLTNYLLRQLAEADHKPERCVFTIQKEVAERLSAEPPNTNKLSAAVGWWAKPFVLGFIRKEDFNPPPEVDGAVVLLLIRDEIKPKRSQQYYRALQAVFRHPRKTILNNLSLDPSIPLNKTELEKTLNSMDINPSARPETLSVENIERIANTWEKQA